ncbi:MAG: 50S ribosomal protein L13 [Microgenomates bacterium OLB22]|nr:MAG: 50S ribosomal protein L13 [Microgenomates bacterium OLB22]
MIRYTKQTKVVFPQTSDKEKVIFDVENKVVGRAASAIARLLIGKDIRTFDPTTQRGVTVVVINASKARLTGRKEMQKLYTSYTGFPGGLREKTFKELMSIRPELVMRHAVYGMLPKNKLRAQMMTRLFIHKDQGPITQS